MTFSSKTQQVLTSPVFIIPTVIVAMSVAWLVKLFVRERAAAEK